MNRPQPPGEWASGIDRFLVVLYLVGIYLGVAVNLPGGIPVPAILAGLAGLALLGKHIARITTAHVGALVAILVLAVLSALTAPDQDLLSEHFKGFVQFAYSILSGFGLFLAARSLPGRWLAGLSLAFCLVILVGCVLETFVPAFKAASDAFRGLAHDSGVYAADLRDQMLYGRVRPKLFTSEPSFVAFGFTLFAFVWYALSRMPGRMIVYLCLLAAGYYLMRGPTMLLGVGLVAVHEILLASRHTPAGGPGFDWPRALGALAVSMVLVAAAMLVGSVLLEERIAKIVGGYDLSFFARIVAPPLIAFDVLRDHPFTGAGIGGWEFIEQAVGQLYATTSWLEIDLQFESAAHAITNWFWIHWIFLGLFFGTAMIVALTWLLRALAVPSALFCWVVWIVFGQAAGGYVDPRTWTVFFVAALVAVIHEREARSRYAAVHMPMPVRAPATPSYPAATYRPAPRAPALVGER